MGAVALAADVLAASARLGRHDGRWRADRGAGFCLGLCACAPAALLDDEPLARLTPPLLDTDALAAEARGMTTLYLPCDAAAVGARRRSGAASRWSVRRRRRGLHPRCHSHRLARRCSGWNRCWRSKRPAGRIAYGPVTPGGCRGPARCGAARRAATIPSGSAGPKTIPWFARQTRLTFARCGIVDPASVEDYRAHGGYAGLDRALAAERACRSSMR